MLNEQCIENSAVKKQYNSLINRCKNNKIFNKYDEILVKRYFSNIQDLSLTENIINIKTLTLTPADIKNIVEKFITHQKINKADIQNILKVSNLADFRVEHYINDNTILKIGEKIANVSRETTSICVDFELLRILDNFISYIKIAHLKNNFNAIRKSLFRKIMCFDYKKSNIELRVNYICWINRILDAYLKEDINTYEFMDLCRKLIYLMPNYIDLHWEIIHILNFLCFHPRYCCSSLLRKFKRNMLKSVKIKYQTIIIDKDNILDIMFDILSQQDINRENFYYLFDLIKIFSDQSDDDKLCSLDICTYLLYRDKKQNIFCFRFVREMFLRILEYIIKKDDNYLIKEKEICFMFLLLENENFSYLYSNKIFMFIDYLINSMQQQSDNKINNKIKKYIHFLNLTKSENHGLNRPFFA